MALAVVTGAAALLILAARRGRFDFRGKTVLVSGGSRGLGLVLARELIRAGVAGLAICARDRDALERARRELHQLGGRVLAVPADVGDPAQVAELVRQILAACRRGDAEVVLSLPAKAVSLVHGLLPGLTADLLTVVNRFLPGPGGLGQGRAKGRDSESAVSPAVLTALGDAAARRNNQIA